jgi:hypothetical protein
MFIMTKLSCILDDIMPNVMFMLTNSVTKMIICIFMWPMQDVPIIEIFLLYLIN